ncbi:hypothetical protein NFC81_10000 [Salinispirillum sp. LH 10-3-1]|uniref:DUF4041 domain-containing protein n=1 Tax=Salinispirillum sp. LH 10-3-1 TaxID=2952525 RepID=A0AB38YD17_9GAMM
MYIEPLALFIIAEVLLAVIIVSGFLFYKSRLLRVMIAILTHLRKERARREMERRAELARLRQENKALAADVVRIREDSGKSYGDLVQDRLSELDDAPDGEDNETEEADEEAATDDSNISDLRRAFLEYEAALASPYPNPKDTEEAFIKRIEKLIGKRQNLIPVDSELGQLQEQVELHKKRIHALERYESMHTQALEELEAAKAQVAELRSITIDPSAPGYEPATSGEHAEEIYRLKCERFDLLESINDMRLKLQKAIADDNSIEVVEIMEQQIKHQTQYMKESDMAITLLEKELEASNKSVAELKEKLASMKPAAGVDPATVQEFQKLNTEGLDKLNDFANDQKNNISAMRENLLQFKAAQQEEERAELMVRQEQQIQSMESTLKESETCVMILENELNDANNKIEQLQVAAQQASENTEANRHANEMENLLRKFVTDSEDMVACIGGLENENIELRTRLMDMGVEEDALPKHALPPEALKVSKPVTVTDEKAE